MTDLKHINWFRLVVVVGLSVSTSFATIFIDETISKGEIVQSILQALIVFFSFLQCPEDGKTTAIIHKTDR